MVARLKLARQSTHRVEVAWQVKTDKTQFHRMSFRFLDFLFLFFPQTLDNLMSFRHEAIGGFFGASYRRVDTTSFERANKREVTVITELTAELSFTFRGLLLLFHP